MLDDVIRKGRLLDLYGALLTEKQRQCVHLYYNQDWSLREIGEALSVSRQGVYDTLHRSVQALEEYEKQLHLLAKNEKNNAVLTKLTALLAEQNPDISAIRCMVADIEI